MDDVKDEGSGKQFAAPGQEPYPKPRTENEPDYRWQYYLGLVGWGNWLILFYHRGAKG